MTRISDGLRLPEQDLPGGMGGGVASGMAGGTEVQGVWVAGNTTDLFAQVGASAAAGALAGAHMNAHQTCRRPDLVRQFVAAGLFPAT